MNVATERETATYSGNINLDHFDLGTWTDNPDLGEITFTSKVAEGKGLTGESAAANLSATIDTFFFKNYRYENIAVNGRLEQKLFSGNLEVHDDNIDLTFAGDIDLRTQIPRFDFKSNINILNLKKLNITEEKLLLSGAIDMDLRNTKLSKMEGEVDIRSLAMTKGGESYRADSIILKNSFVDSVNKKFEVDSDILTAKLEGEFDIEQIPNALIDYYIRNFPTFMSKFGVKKPRKAPKDANFKFEAEVLKIGNLTHLIHKQLDTLEGLKIKGYFNSFEDKIKLDALVPRMKIAGWDLSDIGLQNQLVSSQGHLNLSIFKTEKGKTELAPIVVFGLVDRDTVEFGLTHTFNFQTFEDLNLDGKFFVKDDAYQINFDPSTLVIGKHEWEIPAINYLRFDKNSFETKNFQLKNDDKSIVIESTNENRGLKFDFQNFNLDFIEELWSYKPMDFSGNFALTGEVRDIFNLKNFKIDAAAESFKINGDDFGKMDLDIRLKDLQSVLFGKFNLAKGEQKLVVDGKYLLPSAVKAMKKQNPAFSQVNNYFDLDVDVIKFPIKMLEYWVTTGISNTGGTITSNDLRVYGYPKKPRISGTAFSEEGVVTINYLNTTYWIDKGQLVLNDQLIDATGSVLRDSRGNFADVYGGLTHINLKKLGLDARIKTDKFEALNTKKSKDAVFYGYAIGSGDVRFTGDFKQTNIDVIARTGKETSIKVPIANDNSASEVSFIEFVDKKRNQIGTVSSNSGSIDLRGINLTMQISVTEDADMYMIFDEKAGDIIHGKGKGDIDIKVLRDGTFSMNGDYFIESGEYLFTLAGIVNKQFQVERGGTIRWYGDPFGADINIVAKYADLNAPINSLILEYLDLMSDDLKREAGQATRVNLTMNLQGQLLKPDINFDIDFPDLSGELKTYVQSKLRVLQNNQNELNRQVFGLMVTGQFLPTEFQFNTANLAGTTFSTVSEWVSNQVTLYIRDLLSDLITNSDIFTDIDFDLAYQSYQSTGLNASDATTTTTARTVQVNLKPSFLDNRLTFNVGSEFNVEDDANNPQVRAGNFSAGDFTVEYAISKDKRLKLKVYASTETTVAGNKTRYGGGFRYRREFDSFKELFSGLKKEVKKLER